MPFQLRRALGFLLVIILAGCEKKPEGTPLERAHAAVKSFGGSVVVDKNKPDQPVIQVVLRETPVTDDGLLAISAFNQLEELDLSFCRKVSDQGMAHLKSLSRLRNLNIWNTPITDRSLEYLGSIEAIEVMNLGLCPVTDEGIKHLAKLKNLRSLDLASSKVTDACLPHLKSVQELRLLNLHNASITDAGLVQLAEFKQLEDLGLVGTQVTDDGVRKLLLAIPKLRVFR